MTGFSSSRNFILLALGVLIFCAANPEATAQQRSSVEDKELVNARSAYIDGLAAFENENYRQSIELLRAAYVKLPEHPGVNFALSDAYYATGDLANAEYYGKQAIKLDPKNLWYRLKLADIYREGGKNESAMQELKKARQYHPNNSELLYELAQAYSNDGQPLKANQVYNRLLYLKGEDIGLRLQRLGNFNSVNMQDSAVAELEKIRDLSPGNISTLQVLASEYIEMDKLDEAREVLKSAIRINDRNTQILLMLSDIYVKQAQWDSLEALLTKTVTDPAAATQHKISVTRNLYTKFKNDRDNENLRSITGRVLEKLMENEAESGGAQKLAAEFFVSTNQPEPALKALEKTNRLTPADDTAWKQRLQLLLSEGKVEQAVEVGRKAAEAIPQDPVVLYFLGSAHYSNGNHKEAMESLSEATELPARRPLKSSIWATLGDASAAAGDWSNAFLSYEQSLELDPDNPVVLNNYAYYLSTRDRNLDKAERMARKALSLEPNNPSYLDTMGWIHYKKGEYEKAEKHIRKSLDTGRASAEVMEHLGDVLDKLNRTEEAQMWWKKALEKDSTRTHLKKKITADSE